MTDLVAILISVPTEDEAARIARALVDERLAPSANIIPRMRSIYRWKGAIHDATEALLLVKTRRDRVNELEARVRALHSYEVPSLVVLPIESALAEYLAWVHENTT